MLYGNNSNSGENFGKVYNEASGPMELSNGQWEFIIISYDGTTPLTGNIRCGRGAAELTGGEQAVALTLSTANCADPIFGNAGSKDVDSQPWPLTLYSCMNRKAVEDRMPTDCEKGVAGSHQIALLGFDNDSANGQRIISGCIEHFSMTFETSSVKIPFFELGNGSIPYQVLSYTDSSCATAPDVYIFNNSYRSPSFPNFGTALTEAGASNNVYLYKNPCSTALYGQGGTSFSFFDPDLGSASLICNSNQLESAITGAPTSNYALGRDIDFGNASLGGPIIGTAFSGILDGKGYEIRNLTIDCSGVATGCGLFEEINTPSQAGIKDLSLTNISVITNGSSAKVGALAGALNTGASVRNLRARNILIEAISGASAIGGIVGEIGTGGGIENSKISQLKIDMENNVSVGGLVGTSGDGSYIRHSLIEDIKLVSGAANSTGAQKVGGLVGSTTGTGTGLEIYDVYVNEILFEGDDGDPVRVTPLPFEASDAVGGLVGEGGVVRIKRTGIFGLMDIEPRNGSFLNAGGLMGASSSGQYQIENVMANLTIDTTNTDAGSGVGNNVGGIIGGINGGQGSIAKARNIANIDCNNACGGIIGLGTNGAASIYSELINTGQITATGTIAGGLVAQGGDISFLDSVNRGNVTGTNNVGGVIGVAAGVTITKTINGGNLSGGAGIVGGLVGDSASGTNSCAESVTYGNINGTGTRNELVGIENVALGEVNCFYKDLALGETVGTAATLAELSDPGSAPLTAAAFDSLSDVNSNLVFVADAAGIKTSYEVSMNKLGINLTGNSYNPFSISTVAEWNSIGDDPFLMDMVLRLDASLDFAFPETFTPIASLANCFSGKFLGNGHEVANMTVTESASGDPLGVFRKLCSVSGASDNTAFEIDHYDEFANIDYSFTIRNPNFTSDESVGALAGDMVDLNTADANARYEAGTIFNVDVIGGRLESTGPFHAGGLIGNVTHNNPYTEIMNINIRDIDVVTSGSGNAGGVVGFFGGLHGSPLSSEEPFNLIFVSQLTVDSAQRAGGIVGYLSHADIPLTRISVSDSSIAGSGAVGGIVGTSINNSAGFIEVATKFTTLTDKAGSSYMGGILGEAQMDLTMMIHGAYAHQITFSDTVSTQGGIVGLTGGSGGGLDLFGVYATILDKGASATFGGIIGSDGAMTGAVGATSSYYYFDDNAHGFGTKLNNLGDINNSALVPDLQIGTEFLIFGADYPRKPFEIFPDMFIY